MSKEILVAYGVNIDAVGGRLGSCGGENSLVDISRGLFAGEIGIPRMLELFRKYGINATFFAPGHSIETFPGEMEMVINDGHEIGMHGYSHENPVAMTPGQEEDVLVKCIDLIRKLTGQNPAGYASPWEFSPVTAGLLSKYGVKYDHSLMHNDLHPYYVRVGDSWTRIDYSREAKDWMEPLVRGKMTRLVEIPANGYLDDRPPMMFVRKNPDYGFANPRDIFGVWQDTFDYCYREYDYAVFAMTVHPDVSGRPQCLLAHERLIEHINAHNGIRWATFDEIADDFIQRFSVE